MNVFWSSTCGRGVTSYQGSWREDGSKVEIILREAAPLTLVRRHGELWQNGHKLIPIPLAKLGNSQIFVWPAGVR